MPARNLSRRDFIHLVGIGAFSLALSSCQLQSIFESQEFEDDSQEQTEPDIELSLIARPDTIALFEGKSTTIWRYHGEVINGPPDTIRTIPNSYLGPIISVNKGMTVRIHFTNDISEPSIIHWHGLHVPVEADGHPRLAVDSGEKYTYTFKVSDRAGTYWYHPHPHGRTAIQVYAGLAGLFIVHDDEEKALGLPEGEFDIPLVIQDRRFNEEGQLSYSGTGMMNQMIGFLGDQILINGNIDTDLPVKTHPYRFRLLNGSNSRIYKLAWEDNTPLTVLGTDGGLLEEPLQRSYITLAPAQRVDLWVDFSNDSIGHQKTLVNLPFGSFGGEVEYPILSVHIEDEIEHELILPDKLSNLQTNSVEAAMNRKSPRIFELAMTHEMNWTLNGRSFEMESVSKDEIVTLGDTEIWEFRNQGGNGMGMMGGMELPHPIHIHGLQFQVIERGVSNSGRSAWETLKDGFIDEGWHDTVLVMPGEFVRVLLKFEDYTGLYLYHCHNLEHEDMGMMRNFRVDA
jgi:FtsP/CotA-like multicopper oxidase with cupredoxin domain